MEFETRAIADQVAEMRAQADAILTVCPGVTHRPGACPDCEYRARLLRENADRLEARSRGQFTGEAA
jgi:hypothetical protein